jgi:hypothetical protein
VRATLAKPKRLIGALPTAAQVGLVGLASALGCVGSAGELLPLTVVAPLSASVGREVSVPLAMPVRAGSGSDRDQDVVEWDWRSLTLPDLPSRLRRPSLTAYTLGRAVWRWTPVATDEGPQEIEFSARILPSGGRGLQTLRFVVDSGVTSALFREPVGEGTTLDLRREECVHVAIVVESSASARVDLSLGGEVPENATLVPQSDTTGELVFCPSPEQVAADTIYPFVLQATDDRQTIQKTYVVVLRRAM